MCDRSMQCAIARDARMRKDAMRNVPVGGPLALPLDSLVPPCSPLPFASSFSVLRLGPRGRGDGLIRGSRGKTRGSTMHSKGYS